MSGVWLSRTLLHLIVSGLADASGKSDSASNTTPSMAVPWSPARRKACAKAEEHG